MKYLHPAYFWSICFALLTPAYGAPVADGYRVKWVDKQFQHVAASKDENRFESIGWANSLAEAIELADKHHRPVFAFMYSGYIGSGRC